MTASIFTGLKEDVQQLLYNFVNQKHHTFSSFSEVWKEMQFHHIYSGRPTVLEMKCFTRELLLVVKSHAMPKYTKWERSGAIFLLHALYFIQPLVQKVQIRIEQHEWQELSKFIETMQQVNEEVTFCFYKLVVNNAFDFCFTSRPYTLETMKEDESLKKNTKCNESQSNKQKKYKYDKFAMGSLLTSIGFDPNTSSERENKYNEIKVLLNQKFPEICKFEERKFAVNLLVPNNEESTGDDQIESSESVQNNSSKTTNEKKRAKKKKFNVNALSSYLPDDKIIDSSLSMPRVFTTDNDEDLDSLIDDPDLSLNS
ncbi:hypothetical protein O3M35_012065 [Rhynocoris fuscipes]|uniref:snRNA-activating protein complex subunit 1 n=1 Tax=Rhynocoris fuscipes TaxID=488301 RepID=A0AAW1CUL3_9HEMI